MEVEISKIILKISGKEINLTVEQAQELREKLNNLLGVKEKVYIPIFQDEPRTPRPYVFPPIVTWGTAPCIPNDYTITIS